MLDEIFRSIVIIIYGTSPQPASRSSKMNMMMMIIILISSLLIKPLWIGLTVEKKLFSYLNPVLWNSRHVFHDSFYMGYFTNRVIIQDENCTESQRVHNCVGGQGTLHDMYYGVLCSIIPQLYYFCVTPVLYVTI